MIEKELRESLPGELRPKIEKEESEKVIRKHNQEMADLKAKHENEMEIGNPIENELNRRIEKRINEKVVALICDALNALSKYNESTDKEKSEHPLEEKEQKLHDALQNYFESLFSISLKKAAATERVDSLELKNACKEDFQQVARAFFDFIASNNLGRPDESKLSLEGIFKLLTPNKE